MSATVFLHFFKTIAKGCMFELAQGKSWPLYWALMTKQNTHPSAEGTSFQFPLPASLIKVLARLQHKSYRVVVVGGAVRDHLRGVRTDDYDLASNAIPEQVQGLFRRCLPTGLPHGTVTIMQGRTGYEITTFRSEALYRDGRRPEQVEFIGDLHSDLERRDFSINALAFEPQASVLQQKAQILHQGCSDSAHRAALITLPGLLHDLHGGRKDLEHHQIRAIGNPGQRFAEDALRMLRACRFSAKLNFAIEEQTLAAICDWRGNLSKVSKPRIQEELRRLLCADYAPRGLRYLAQSGLWEQVFVPGLRPPASVGAQAEPLDQFDKLFATWRKLYNWPQKPEYTCPDGPILQPFDKLRKYIADQGQAGSPFWRWNIDKIPTFSFAWTLLHYTLLPPEPRCFATDESMAEVESALEHPTASSGTKEFCNPAGIEARRYRLAEQGLNELRFSNREKQAALWLLAAGPLVWGPDLLWTYRHRASPEERRRLLRRWLAYCGADMSLPSLWLLALSNGCDPEALQAVPSGQASLAGESDLPSLWREFAATMADVLSESPALSLKELAVDGTVLLRECGIPAGPQLGRILQKLLDLVLQNPERNRAADLRSAARQMYAQEAEQNADR